ncbi:MAG: hypothetical protein QOJ52_4420 [Acidimicrobiaceae bacterium]|jgi:hypothetical protein|nr:hypothetical protein [Acidimicrobiaceae bacterium]
MDHSPHVPDEEADIDREIRIERMKRELDEIVGGEMRSRNFGPVPLRMEEAFLKQVLAYERAEFDTNFNRLVQRGVALPPAAELENAALSAKLEEVIRELSELRCFLDEADHLSDRELYDWLWSSGLCEESPDVSEMPNGAWHTSPIGAGNNEDTEIWLKYYANDEERQRWHLDYPTDPMPAHEALPFDRDRHLPKRSAS